MKDLYEKLAYDYDAYETTGIPWFRFGYSIWRRYRGKSNG